MSTIHDEFRVIAPSGATSIFGKEDNSSWAYYEVGLEFVTPLAAGIPGDKKTIEGWIESKLGRSKAEQLRLKTRQTLIEVMGIDPDVATAEEIDAAIEAYAGEEKASVFKRTPSGFPYIEGRICKAMLKEATNIAFPQGKVKWGQYANQKGGVVGGKSPKSYLAERVFTQDAPIVVGSEVSGMDMAVGHIPDFRSQTGSRATLSYYEYMSEGTTITFKIRVLDDFVKPSEWNRLWELAEENGLGARRSQSCGKFVVTRFDRI